MGEDRYEYLYRPLLERSLENYLVQHLARNYDFGKESRVASLLVRKINAEIEQVEQNLGILRIDPFHLYLKWRGADLALPLFASEYLSPILHGNDGFRASRKLVFAACGKAAKQTKIANYELRGVIDPRFSIRSTRRWPKAVDITAEGKEHRHVEQLREQIQHLRPNSPFERIDVLDKGAPSTLVDRLSRFVEQEGGQGPTVANHMVQELITLRNVCCPRTRHLESGEMPFLATSVNAHLSEEVATRFRRLKPVILTVWTKEELQRRPWDNRHSDEELTKRIVRVCFEAYRQGGLLSLMDLQWIFQVSSTLISTLIRTAQKQATIIVPTPGTILDAGRSMTHKGIIIELHLQGHTVREISRITFHSPRAVDNYIGTFESVLILDLYHIPKRLMARILKKGITLIEEHLNLARKHFRDEEDRKRLLAWKEANF
jgi:hypothetical protein